MLAIKLQQPGGPEALTLAEVPIPEPGPDEVLVRVAACGFCHHDLLVMKGVLRRGLKPGLVPGHEISGVVVQVGENVTSLKLGEQVVSLLVSSCGHCDRCLEGREHRCRNGQGIGHGRDGGFAQYVVVSEFGLVAVPEGVDLISAALFACPMGVALQGLRQAAHLVNGVGVVVGVAIALAVAGFFHE